MWVAVKTPPPRLNDSLELNQAAVDASSAYFPVFTSAPFQIVQCDLLSFPLFRARFAKKVVSVQTGLNLFVLKILLLDPARYFHNLVVEAF